MQPSTLNVHKILKMIDVPVTSKHRRCDTTKAKLVMSTPETVKGLGLSQQTAFCPQKAMLAGLILLLLKPSFN